MEKFDIAVIGGGPSGYAATMRALDLNKKVILVEQSVIGGAGLHNGALSSKPLWELSKSVYQMKTIIHLLILKYAKLWKMPSKQELNNCIFN